MQLAMLGSKLDNRVWHCWCECAYSESGGTVSAHTGSGYLWFHTAEQHDEHDNEAGPVLAVYAMDQHRVVVVVHKDSQGLCNFLLALHHQGSLSGIKTEPTWPGIEPAWPCFAATWPKIVPTQPDGKRWCPHGQGLSINGQGLRSHSGRMHP